ncbi:MAG TPA: DinB family protein [Chitinophagaceae bacterium]|nr:DinB family protein [Chitinophagaceae bacterium]
MKKISTHQLLDDLQSDTRKIILAATELLREDPGVLTRAPEQGKWSIAQVIEHLNSYGRYYLPAIESALNNNSYEPDAVFKPGWLGDYFTRSMLPKNGQVLNKMQSPKDHRPHPDIDSKPVIDTFLQQEQLLLDLLERAKHADISRIRIPISLSKLVKLKLGDTFRFLVAHHQRHFVQIDNALKMVRRTSGVNV